MISHANKAVLAAVLAALVALLAELRDRAPVTVLDWVVIVLGAVVAGLGVYLIPNTASRHRA